MKDGLGAAVTHSWVADAKEGALAEYVPATEEIRYYLYHFPVDPGEMVVIQTLCTLEEMAHWAQGDDALELVGDKDHCTRWMSVWEAVLNHLYAGQTVCGVWPVSSIEVFNG